MTGKQGMPELRVAMIMKPFQFCLAVVFTTLLAPSADAADCSEDLNVCTPAQICERATEAISGHLYWIADPTDPYLSLARKFNLDCGSEDAPSQCMRSADACSIVELCEVASAPDGTQDQWNPSYPEHIALAQSFGLDCGVPDALQVETGGEGPQATISESHQQSLSQKAGELLEQVDIKTKLDMPVMEMMQEYPACPETRPFENCFAEDEGIFGEGGQNPIEYFEFGVWKANHLWTGFHFKNGDYEGHLFEGNYFPVDSCRQRAFATAWNDWYECPNGASYRALEALDGQPDGRGHLEWVKVKGSHAGTVSKQRKFGRWEYRFATGNVYVGDYVNDQRTGRGTFTFADGDVYEGEYVNGQRTGHGTYTWANGNVYEGDFVNNQLTGQGTLTGANGDVYEGDFVDGLYDGQGTYTFANGDVSEGRWSNDKYLGP